MTGEAKKWWRDFATWATKEQALKNLTELVLEVNEMLDEILPPLLAEQKRSGNSLVKPKPSTLALTADEPTVLIPIEQLEFILSLPKTSSAHDHPLPEQLIEGTLKQRIKVS